MKIVFMAVGKAHDGYVRNGVEDFTARLANYFPVQWQVLPTPKNGASLSPTVQKQKEGEAILHQLKPTDFLIALDERGRQLTSVQLSQTIQQRANESTKQIVFLIGGAFGLDAVVLKAARMSWSLSSLTFPHQLVRLILAEQVYRACTILANEKYHHE